MYLLQNVEGSIDPDQLAYLLIFIQNLTLYFDEKSEVNIDYAQ